MRDVSKCADCKRGLLASDELVLRLMGAFYLVQRTTGKHVFICWHCADERYKARRVRAR